jgi:protein SCO1/2
MRPFTVFVAATIFAACAPDPRSPTPDVFGRQLAEPLPRPDFTFTATDGQPFHFRERTAGKLTLLFFGFTNCPDICPVHAANVAAVYRTLSWEDRQRTQFVFVTTDPGRDSLPAIRAWLDRFDSSFIGLRGPSATVDSVLAALQAAPTVRTEPDSVGAYDVMHYAGVYVIQPDDRLRFVYPFGVRQEHWAADIPKLLATR